MGYEFTELIRTFLPKYLSPEQKDDLWSELRSFPQIDSYYDDSGDLADSVLQGDGWRGLIVLDFLTARQKPISGLVLSNSCDIAPGNRRRLPTNVVFAPMLPLDRYIQNLRAAGQTDHQITGLVDALRRQEVTTAFFLPGVEGQHPDRIALLDDVHSHPLSHFLTVNRSRRFRLSMVAFYVFVMKLSIHFCRFQEGVIRASA